MTSNDEELLSSLLQQTDTNSESEWSTQEVEDGGAKCVNKDCELIVIRWNVSQIACLTMKCQIVIRWIVSQIQVVCIAYQLEGHYVAGESRTRCCVRSVGRGRTFCSGRGSRTRCSVRDVGGGGERVLSQLHKVGVPGLHGNAQVCSVRSVGRVRTFCSGRGSRTRCSMRSVGGGGERVMSQLHKVCLRYNTQVLG